MTYPDRMRSGGDMMLNIRNEQPGDYRASEEVTREAFWNLYCPGCVEHFIVHTMRNHPDFIPELAFVAELDGKVIGSIFYTRSKIIARDDRQYDVVTFGPVSILPRLHRRGFGRTLITHSIRAATDLGYRAILIGGYPYHYEPYGFVGAKKYGISMPDGKYYTGIMALPLCEGALDGMRGSLHFSTAFEPDESGFAEFDGTFPPAEKRVQESQRQFEKASTEIDDRFFD